MPPFSIKIIQKLDDYLLEQMEQLNQNSTDFCYSEKTPQEIEEHQDKFCSADEIKHWVLAIQDEKIIGRLAVFKREIALEGKRVTLGGIGKVKVRDDKRRQGVASKLVQEAMPLFLQMSCDLVYLCTNINNPIMVKFYGKYGFKHFVPGCTYLGKSGKQYLELGAMFAPVNQEVFEWLFNHSEPFSIGCGNW